MAVVLHSGPRHGPTSMSLGRALRRKEIDACYIGQSPVYGATVSTFGLVDLNDQFADAVLQSPMWHILKNSAYKNSMDEK